MPRARGTVAPKHRIQGNNPQVPATGANLEGTPDVCSGWGRGSGQLWGPHPAQGLHVGPLQGAERPQHTALRLQRVLSSLLSPHRRHTGLESWTRTASEVFWQLLPRVCRERAGALCWIPPWADHNKDCIHLVPGLSWVHLVLWLHAPEGLTFLRGPDQTYAWP